MATTSRRPRRPASNGPAGFRYVPDLIDPEQEAALIHEIGALPFQPVVFRGVTARRRVLHLGWRYDFEGRGVSPGLPIPDSLLTLRELVSPLADLPAERFEEVLVTEYSPGATIGWHRDAPAFGSAVLGVSLGTACRLRFRRRKEEAWETWEQTLDPRSAYLISGAARSAWQHSIPPTDGLRYSVTYRTVREHDRHLAG
jgi:alkylated DNA repair protein (DNA oxidative demethylase)